MTARAHIEKLLPLKPVDFLVLLVLVDGERHGYGIVRDIEERTGGQVRLLPGNLYAMLRRLMKAGLLAEAEKRPASDLGDERRRYYRITELGEAVAAAEARRMKTLVDAAESRGLLEGSTVGG